MKRKLEIGLLDCLIVGLLIVVIIAAFFIFFSGRITLLENQVKYLQQEILPSFDSYEEFYDKITLHAVVAPNEYLFVGEFGGGPSGSDGTFCLYSSGQYKMQLENGFVAIIKRKDS